MFDHIHDISRTSQLPASFTPASGYENMSYAEFVKQREQRNLQAMGSADLHRKQTQMPTFKSFVSRMQAQNFPSKTILNSAKPPLTACITPVNPNEIEDPNRQYVTATFSTDGYTADPKLSSHPVRQYVSKKSPYLPSGHKEVFIKGTNRAVPPVIFQNQITSAAKVYSIMRHQNVDTEPFENVFRWMWGLPKEFSLSPYAPLIDSDITKPWVHLKAKGNYEVQYMSAQQGMIHVTTGSETGVYAGTKYEVDWEFIRTVARNIMTRVMFIEDHRNELEKMSGFKMKFYVRYDNHFPQYIPKWDFKKPDTASLLTMPNDQLLLLAGAIAEPSKLYVFPKLLMDYMVMNAPVSIPIIATIPKKLPKTLDLEVDEADLTDTLQVAYSYEFRQPLRIEDDEIVRQPLRIGDMVKQYFIQYGMTNEVNLKRLLTVTAYAKFKSYDHAYEELLDFIDMNELTKLNSLYMTINVNRYSASRDIWDFYVGKESHFNKIQSLEPRFLINHAKYLKHESLIKCINDSIRCIQQKLLVPNAYTLVRYMRPFSSYDENLLSMKKAIRDLIEKFYVIGYLKKLKAAKNLLLNETDKDKLRALKESIIKYQFLSKLFPLVNGKDQPSIICDFIYEMALRYVKKRSRYHSKMKDFQVNTHDPFILATKLDKLVKSSFVKLLSILYEAIYQADHDIDVFFMSDTDYLITYNKNRKFAKRMRLLTSIIMPTYIKQLPDKERYVVKPDDQELYKDLICENNESYLTYAHFNERYKVPKLMKNRPAFLSRVTHVKIHNKKKKGKQRYKEKDSIITPEPPVTIIENNEKVPEVSLTIAQPPEITYTKETIFEPEPEKANDDGLSFLDNFDYEEEIDFNQIWPSDYISVKSLPWTLEGVQRISDLYKLGINTTEPSTIDKMDALVQEFDKEITAVSVALLRVNRGTDDAQPSDIIS